MTPTKPLIFKVLEKKLFGGIAYNKVWPRGQGLAQLQLPQTKLCPSVIVRGFIPHPPSHVHYLELVPPGLTVSLEAGIRFLHPSVPLKLRVCSSLYI